MRTRTVVETRWVGVGRSQDPDARTAGAQATREALTGHDPKLLIVFAWDRYDQPAMLAGIADVAGDVPLIGCSTAGEIATDGPGDEGVVVTALGGPGFSAVTGAGTAGVTDPRGAAMEAVACVEELEAGGHPFVLLLTDGLIGSKEEVVRGAYAMAGATIPLVGGFAGDGLRMEATTQLHGQEVLQGSVVAAAIRSDSPIGIGVQHGWSRLGKPVVVTHNDGVHVLTLNDAPALDVYLDALNAPDEVRTDPSAFAAFAATHPLGLSQRSADVARFIGGGDFERRSLTMITEVPQGQTVWFMNGDDQTVLDASDAACRQALTALDGLRPRGLLAFDCIARRSVLGTTGIQREIDRLATHVDGAPVAGFYTYGEIARVRGLSGFHNQTLVVLAVS